MTKKKEDKVKLVAMPHPPTKPKEPSKFFETTVEAGLYFDTNGSPMTLQDFVESYELAVQSLISQCKDAEFDPANIRLYFQTESDYYDGYTSINTKVCVPALFINPRYEKELIAYESKATSYNTKLKKYQEQQTVWLAQERLRTQEKLEKLERQAAKLRKELTKDEA